MQVSFFSSNSGRCYVEVFIDDLSVIDRAAVLAVLKDIEIYGLSATGCQFRQIEGKLWEIKIKAPHGGTVVEINSGAAALALALVLGKRACYRSYFGDY